MQVYDILPLKQLWILHCVFALHLSEIDTCSFTAIPKETCAIVHPETGIKLQRKICKFRINYQLYVCKQSPITNLNQKRLFFRISQAISLG